MILNEIANYVIEGKDKKVAELVKKAIKEKIRIKDILDNGLIAGMNVIGERFKKNEIFIPEVLVSARAMKKGMEILQPHIVKADIKPIGKVIIGTVKGDLHDIGKNIVSMMLQGAGFQVIDLGIDTPAEKFYQKLIEEEEAQVLGMSALLTTTMEEMPKVIEFLKKAKVRDKVKIIVGGAPVTEKFAQKIGADSYAPDAATAVDKVKELIATARTTQKHITQ